MFDEYHDLYSEIYIRQRLENKVSGRFILFRSNHNDIDSSLITMIRDNDDLDGMLSARTLKLQDVTSTLDIKYRGNGDVEAHIEAIAASFLECTLEVRPHNRLFGRFELLEAPRIDVRLPALADATTRSRNDLRTINYGDMKSMLTGKNTEEAFESFVSFGELKDRIPDLKILEGARLRLYYINFPRNANLELHQPNTLWRELGVTHANQPYSVELLSDQYVHNTTERYIEFDVLDIAKRWESSALLNYGFIIKTSNNEPLSFFTKESGIPPLLIVNYITSQIYSPGRTDLESTVFINGKGYKEITGYLTVHSDVGFSTWECTLYVHRKEDPMFTELASSIAISRPGVQADLTIARREYDHIESTLTVASKLPLDMESNILASVPDLFGEIIIDPYAFLSTFITIAIVENDEVEGSIIASKPDLSGNLTVTSIKKSFDDLNSSLIVKNTLEEDLASQISASKPDISAAITVRALAENDLDSKIELPYHNILEAHILSSTPDLAGSIVLKYKHEMDAVLWIKDKEWLDAAIDVRQITELEAALLVKQIHEIESNLIVNVPDLTGYLYPRVSRVDELDCTISIRKRDVSDMDSILLIKGSSNGAYYFIM
ncbi:DNRLRE domain-containing protein [Paenibacillus glucanolyticus]